ncbi:MAG TPA: DNA repair exonuclease [Abditibacteriaceae bacterium]|nr:DNA repair exonuclease [Abditibacteriaceae bacterium]
MKILHTADWHMNDTLGRVDRTDDILRAVEQIAAYLEQHEVDVLIVAGDLFSERSRPDAMRRAVGKIKDIFLPFLARGGTMLAISGNHDSEVFFETMRDALDLVAPGKRATGSTHAVGRLWVAPNARTITLADAHGTKVQFVLMPYPTARGYLQGTDQSYATIEEKHRAIQSIFRNTLDDLKSKIDETLPSVLVSHIHVRGAQAHTLYKVTEVEDVIFEPGDIPTGWAYVAFGHIHKPQAPLAGASHIRYCGSIERLDYAERDDQKSVVLIEVGPQGRIGEPQLLPLQSTPLHRIEIYDPSMEMAQLKQRYPDAATALVNYTLHWQPGRDNRDAICRELNEIFPRWYSREFVEIGRGEFGGLFTASGLNLRDVPGTVRDYLQTQLRAHAGREAVLALAESLLAEREKESAAAPGQPASAVAVAAPAGDAAPAKNTATAASAELDANSDAEAGQDSTQDSTLFEEITAS